MHIINIKLSIISSRTSEIEQRFDFKATQRFPEMREVNKSEFCGFYSGLFAVPIIRAVKEDVLAAYVR